MTRSRRGNRCSQCEQPVLGQTLLCNNCGPPGPDDCIMRDSDGLDVFLDESSKVVDVLSSWN